MIRANDVGVGVRVGSESLGSSVAVGVVVEGNSFVFYL